MKEASVTEFVEGRYAEKCRRDDLYLFMDKKT